jgi:hypothetical protein
MSTRLRYEWFTIKRVRIFSYIVCIQDLNRYTYISTWNSSKFVDKLPNARPLV